MAEFLTDHKRTHNCGALRAADAGRSVILFGWVAARRDHGGCVFIDLRDRAGITQVVFEPQIDSKAHQGAGELRGEYCIGITGVVVERGGHKNPNLPTGEIEVKADALTIFSTPETPPFEISDSTLGGARNFLVPSRLNPGQFYALAESPQIFKQLFMVSGFDRYFQIVRCFRDEDLRLDRQPEFTQIDLELSFVVEEDVQRIIEGLMAALWKDVLGVELALPLPRLTYGEAMGKYGSDKPDVRFDLPLVDLTEVCRAQDGGGLGLIQGALK